MDNSNVQWTYACPMDPLDPMDHWTYSLCHLTGLLPAWGWCQYMTSFEITYLMHNQMSSGLMPFHWIQWTNQMSTGHIYVHWIQWTTQMSIGHMHVQWIHWTIGHTSFAITKACYLHRVGVNLWRHSSELIYCTIKCPVDIFLSIGSHGQIKCPVDMCLSIGSNGQLKCPMDICMSNGSIGSNGPLDILPLPSHRPATCMGLMPTYDVFRDSLLNAQPNVQCTYACPLDPMNKSNVHWTFQYVHWTSCRGIGH
jgi:hypothetical protein